MPNSDSQIIVETSTEPSDVNEMYIEALGELRARHQPVLKPAKTPSEIEQEQQAKDYYANVRTNVSLHPYWLHLKRLSVLFD